jgi:acetyltransferase EpsM
MRRESVIVIGAGGLGREVRDAVDASQAFGGPRFGGFLDDFTEGPEVVGKLSAMGTFASTSYIVAIGDPAARASVISSAPPNIEFASLIHPAAVVSPSASVGVGVFIAPMAYVGSGAIVGPHTVVNVHAQVGHDAATGQFVTLSPQVALNGHCVVGEGCFLGTASMVAKGVTIGRWSKVATGACVMRSTGEGFLLAGNPAKGRQMFRPPQALTQTHSEESEQID